MAFKSNDEVFDAVRSLAASLKESGLDGASAGLMEGLGMINGLTDGWADFLSAAKKVKKEFSPLLSRDQKKALQDIIDAAFFAVYRRRPLFWEKW